MPDLRAFCSPSISMQTSEPTYDANVARLAINHPLLFERMPFYSDLPNGWFELVDRLCTDIEKELGSEMSRRVMVIQIKEKFAALRFYARVHAAWDAPVAATDGDGASDLTTARHAFEGLEDSAAAHVVASARERLRDLVNAACEASASICQVCGESGRPRQLAWLRTLCDEHFLEAVAAADRRDAGRS